MESRCCSVSSASKLSASITDTLAMSSYWFRMSPNNSILLMSWSFRGALDGANELLFRCALFILEMCFYWLGFATLSGSSSNPLLSGLACNITICSWSFCDCNIFWISLSSSLLDLLLSSSSLSTNTSFTSDFTFSKFIFVDYVKFLLNVSIFLCWY